MNTLLASIGIEWPREMYVLFDIQSAISTVGDHILKIDCVLSNTHPEQLVLYLQAGYALAPFIGALALYLLMPYCRFRLRAKESIKHLHTNKTMFLKAVVLLLYMSYPSLARQSFAFWHCVGIKGRCVKMMMVRYILISLNMCVSRWMDILGKVTVTMDMETTSLWLQSCNAGISDISYTSSRLVYHTYFCMS